MEHRGRVSVAVILFDGVNSIDVAGPVEAFGCVRTDPGGPGYNVESWTLADSIVRSESRLRLYADGPPPPRPAANILMIPGGKGIRVAATLSRLSSWLRSNHQGFAKIVSICTGAYALAEAGLLEGRQITTHWAHAADLQGRYPEIRVRSDALYMHDGRFYSSGGVTAGIDLALDLIEKDFGIEQAIKP